MGYPSRVEPYSFFCMGASYPRLTVVVASTHPRQSGHRPREDTPHSTSTYYRRFIRVSGARPVPQRSATARILIPFSHGRINHHSVISVEMRARPHNKKDESISIIFVDLHLTQNRDKSNRRSEICLFHFYAHLCSDSSRTMTYELSSLKCLVTGASSGIGQSTCEVLTKYGATVVGTGRNEASLQKMKDAGSITDYVVSDITRDGECSRLVEESVAKLGGSLTAVVNGAGGLRGGPVGAADLENYYYNMRVNCQAPFEIIHASIPHLKKNSSMFPSIVTVSSVNGKQSFASCASYCMSKAAVDQLTRCASVDLAKDGIRVNAVNPGVIKTNLHRVRAFLFYRCCVQFVRLTQCWNVLFHCVRAPGGRNVGRCLRRIHKAQCGS